jgi:hypothetical protein
VEAARPFGVHAIHFTTLPPYVPSSPNSGYFPRRLCLRDEPPRYRWKFVRRASSMAQTGCPIVCH